MDKERLAEIEARARSALESVQGEKPWGWEKNNSLGWDVFSAHHYVASEARGVQTEALAEFIAYAPDDILALIQALRALSAEQEEAGG